VEDLTLGNTNETGVRRCLAESLIASYEARFVTVYSFLDQAMDALQDHRNDLEQVIAQLRDHYAASSSLRKRDFDAMIEQPLLYLRELEVRARGALVVSRLDEQEIVATLRDVLAGGDGAESVQWPVLRDRMAELQQSREAGLARLLREYHAELTNMVELFGAALQRLPRPRVRDLKRLAHSIVQQHAYERTDLGRSQRDLDEIRGQIRGQWGEILATTDAQGR
jgi:hypothetical protein